MDLAVSTDNLAPQVVERGVALPGCYRIPAIASVRGAAMVAYNLRRLMTATGACP